MMENTKSKTMDSAFNSLDKLNNGPQRNGNILLNILKFFHKSFLELKQYNLSLKPSYTRLEKIRNLLG